MRFIRASLSAAVVVTVLFAGTARADDDTARVAALARKLHQEAVAAARTNHWALAIERWQAAEAIDRHWKYAFNLASALEHIGHLLPAWHACVRARSLGLPERHSRSLRVIERRLTAKLIRRHAFVALSGIPAGARVERNGEPWTDWAGTWLPGGESRVTIRATGFLPHTERITHLVGRRRAVEIQLRRAPEPSRRAPVPVAAPGHLAPRPAPPEPAQRTLRLPGWVTLGLGIAAAGTGAGLVVWANNAAASAARLEGNDFATYSRRYDQLAEQNRAGSIAGWTLVGVGAAATVAGATLLVIDAVRAPRSGDGRVRAFGAVQPLRGGVAVGAAVRF